MKNVLRLMVLMILMVVGFASIASPSNAQVPYVTHTATIHSSVSNGSSSVTWTDSATWQSVAGGAVGRNQGVLYLIVYNLSNSELLDLPVSTTVYNPSQDGWYAVYNGSYINVGDNQNITNLNDFVRQGANSNGTPLAAGSYKVRWQVRIAAKTLIGSTVYNSPLTKWDSVFYPITILN